MGENMTGTNSLEQTAAVAELLKRSALPDAPLAMPKQSLLRPALSVLLPVTSLVPGRRAEP